MSKENSSEFAALVNVVEAARQVTDMRAPSVSDLLRKHGFGYEADKVQKLIDAVAAARKTV